MRCARAKATRCRLASCRTTTAPTLDPSALYDDPAATILAFGGRSAGHKGIALALLVEAMATTLADEDTTDPNRVGNNVTILALAVLDRFTFPCDSTRRLCALIAACTRRRTGQSARRRRVSRSTAGDVDAPNERRHLRDLRDVVHRCGVPWTLLPIS